MNNFDMELTQKQAGEYKRSSKKERSTIIDQYCELTGASRNLASKRFLRVIRNFKPKVLKKPPVNKPGRKSKYTVVHKHITRKAWELSGEICGERLYPVLGEYLNELAMAGKITYNTNVSVVTRISLATLKRIIATFPKTKSVKHNGGSSRGQFGITGCYVDVCLGWIARCASLGKDRASVETIHETNTKKIFHTIHEYHPGNAKPILKLLLERRLNPKVPHYDISRSRPYHKEDNGHVEQKNGDKVRKLVGYHRYDREDHMQLLNELYEIEDQISNYFVSSQKLKEKVVDDHGRVISRKHHKAKTAYQRLVESNKISKTVKEKVKNIKKGLRLVELRERSEKIQNELFKKTF